MASQQPDNPHDSAHSNLTGESTAPSAIPDSQSRTPNRFFTVGRLVKAILVLLVLGAGTVVAQRWMTPPVDVEKTQPIVITHSDPVSDGQPTDADSFEVDPHLPPGAVTATINQGSIDTAEHPFDPLLKVASLSLKEIDKNIQDYTATLVSQVRVDGKLRDERYMSVKIRHARDDDGKKVPFSVYSLFMKPENLVGQEVIWVQGWHQGNMVAHPTGLLNVKRFYIDPDSPRAMEGNRYSIREIGFRNLLVKMSDIGKRDREYGECEVTLKRGVEINGQVCSMLQAVHPVPRDHFEFHIARIFIDDERNIPIAYEGYVWPEKEGDPPQLLEKYYYTDIKTNVGLTNKDFDAGNEAYNYANW